MKQKFFQKNSTPTSLQQDESIQHQKSGAGFIQVPFLKKKTGAGFTLIELLVVIAIIGLLASVVLVSLNGARLKARDTKRIADLKQIQTALALYYDANNSYPACGPWVYSLNDTNWTTGCLGAALLPYLSKLPVDPKNNIQAPWGTGNYTYAYGVAAAGQDYDLVAQLEDTSHVLRCQVKAWPYHGAGNVSWCGSYSPYLYADH